METELVGFLIGTNRVLFFFKLKNFRFYEDQHPHHRRRQRHLNHPTA